MICTNGVNRQEQLNALVSSLLEQAECQLDLVFLAERGADLAALCLGEGVGHAAADDDGVALVDQVFDNADLVGNLSAAQDCNERTSRIAQGLAHDRDFLLDQETAYSRQVICDACGGSVCTVCGAECVVDVNVSHVSHSLCKRSVVLGLALFKANILKQNDLARLNLSGQLLSILAYNVLCQLDFLAKQLAQALSNRSQRILHVYFALRTAEVRAQDYSSVVIQQVVNGLQRSTDALVVGDVAVLVLRYVKIAAGNYLLAGYVDILNALLVILHKYPSPLRCIIKLR